jgi:hypothetical protein
MTWSAILNGNTGEWAFHDMSKHPFADKSGPGEVVHRVPNVGGGHGVCG